jgi:hypothetical protein
MRMKLSRAAVFGAALLMIPATAASAPSMSLDEEGVGASIGGKGSKGNFGYFTLMPEFGYMYFGGQKGWADKSNVFEGQDIHAMYVDLKFTWGGGNEESNYVLAPYYMYQDVGEDLRGNRTYGHAFGLYDAYMYYWGFQTENAGSWHPGIGLGAGFGPMLGGDIDWGLQTWLEMPLAVSWYPSKSVPVGIHLGTSVGFQISVMYAKDSFISMGAVVSAVLGARFF